MHQATGRQGKLVGIFGGQWGDGSCRLRARPHHSCRGMGQAERGL